MSDPKTKYKKITVVYDGECPFCSAYVRMVNLRELVDEVEFVDARDQHHQAVIDVKKHGYKIDDGMVVFIDNVVFHGDQAVHMLSVLSTGVGWFNKLNYWIFRSPGRSRFFYPLLKAARNTALLIKGVKKLGY